MRQWFIFVILAVISLPAHADSVEEHILVSYPKIINSLEQHGFSGLFAEEMARYALVRQIIEDGANRPHHVSIVGMSVGEPHASIMKTLDLAMGAVNSQGLKLSKTSSPDGVTFYAIYGPRANVCSATAIGLLWDTYVNGQHKEKFNTEESIVWNASKEISSKMVCDCAWEEAAGFYQSMKPVRTKVFEKVNRLYSPTAAGTINRMVADYAPLFDFAQKKRIMD